MSLGMLHSAFGLQTLCLDKDNPHKAFLYLSLKVEASFQFFLDIFQLDRNTPHAFPKIHTFHLQPEEILDLVFWL